MNGRIERVTPRDEFLVAMFQDDPRLIEALKDVQPSPIELMDELLEYGFKVGLIVLGVVVVASTCGWLLTKVF